MLETKNLSLQVEAWSQVLVPDQILERLPVVQLLWLNRKRDASEVVLSHINMLTKHQSNNSDILTNSVDKEMVCFFSLFLTFTDVSGSVVNHHPMQLPSKAKLLLRGNFFA